MTAEPYFERVNAPVRFPGTPEEAEANRRSHDWVYYDHEEPPECARCCARSYHVAASYPCGQEPPRQTFKRLVMPSE